ncbi:hypothetical protein [Puerhibacterium puerhi]|uniref:hypothetical protein n=1 Tax=Puerhibacterium puerhi TaxID=2692623 RepID=UPI00135C3817|nr:hypothetical protein [Puerhibacterium puerhi]
MTTTTLNVIDVFPLGVGVAIPKLDPEAKEKWLKALRSGEYVQAKNKLNDGAGGFCCLGVLCDISGRGEFRATSGQDYFTFVDSDGHSDYNMPIILVERWAYGISVLSQWQVPMPVEVVQRRHGDEEVQRRLRLGFHEGGVELNELNDTYDLTFEEIADVIEIHL